MAWWQQRVGKGDINILVCASLLPFHDGRKFQINLVLRHFNFGTYTGI